MTAIAYPNPKCPDCLIEMDFVSDNMEEAWPSNWTGWRERETEFRLRFQCPECGFLFEEVFILNLTYDGMESIIL